MFCAWFFAAGAVAGFVTGILALVWIEAQAQPKAPGLQGRGNGFATTDTATFNSQFYAADGNPPYTYSP